MRKIVRNEFQNLPAGTYTVTRRKQLDIYGNPLYKVHGIDTRFTRHAYELTASPGETFLLEIAKGGEPEI